MVNRNAKNGYKIVKKDHINVACELSLSNFQKLAKAYKMGICELVFCRLVL